MDGISIEVIVTQLSRDIKGLSEQFRTDNALIHTELKEIKIELAKLHDYERLKERVRYLEAFKYKLIGGVAVVQGIVTFLITHYAG